MEINTRTADLYTLCSARSGPQRPRLSFLGISDDLGKSRFQTPKNIELDANSPAEGKRQRVVSILSRGMEMHSMRS